MRPIEFRGKRIDNGEWVYGDLITDGKICYIFPFGSGWFEFQSKLVKVNPSTVGQFTGLTDKNGKKIFEGDILRVNWETASTGKYFQSSDAFISHEKIVIVFWYNIGFNYKTMFGKMTSIKVGAETEIIGNIHDNPKLLNQQQ